MVGPFRRFGFAAVVAAGVSLMALVVVGKMLLGPGQSEGGPPVAQAAKGGGGPPSAPNVVTATVALHAFSDAIQAIGTAQARESILITPKAADTIRAIRFDSGDRVRAGQVLVEMANVEQAAGLDEARAANEAAQEELRRFQELYDRGFASQARLDTVRAAANAAEARLDAGSARIADRTLRAPFAGVVGLRTASPGQYVRPGDRIGTLDDVSEVKLDFDVTETQISRLRPSVAISARTAAYPERTFTGEIANVDSRIDATTRTVRVRALLPNRDGALRPGMLLTVEVRSNPRQALAIPEIALLEHAEGPSVFRIVDGAAQMARVEIGQRSSGMAEVLSGLSAGDRVITEGVQSVRPGQSVRVQGEPGSARREAGEAPRPRG